MRSSRMACSAVQSVPERFEVAVPRPARDLLAPGGLGVNGMHMTPEQVAVVQVGTPQLTCDQCGVQGASGPCSLAVATAIEQIQG